MLLLLGEPDDLVLNRGTIARPDAFDSPAVHRRTMEVAPDDLVRSPVGRSQPAWEEAVGFLARGHEREHQRFIVGRLDLRLGEINGGLVHPRGGAGFQSAKFKTEIAQRRR